NTCSGCHGGEGRTQTGNLINDPAGVSHQPFLQIAPQPFGTKATLAAFLTGDPAQPDGLFKITDPANRPAGSPAVRGFNDLQRRAEDLEAFITTTCLKKRIPELIRVLTFKPMKMTH
ncbi:lipoprotein, partial [groundwater metagenome]